MKRRRFLAISACCLIPSMARASGTWRGIALGSDAEIQLSGPAEMFVLAFAQIQALLNEVEAEFSLHLPNSTLSLLNQNGRIWPSPRFARLCRIVDQLHRDTAGIFDPQAYKKYGF